MTTDREPLLREVLGAAVKNHRLSGGLTLREVCGRAGVSVSHWSEVERGRKEVSSEVLAAMCRAVAVPLSQILLESSRALAADYGAEAEGWGSPARDAACRRVIRPAETAGLAGLSALPVPSARRPATAPRRRTAPAPRLRVPSTPVAGLISADGDLRVQSS